MWDYSEKVKEHFYNPKNAGAVDGANAIGDVGSLSCGDALRLTLKVDPETDVILDAGFQTFGCGSAIASSSALTEMVKGLTLDDALKISNQDIADFLDGLPPEKMHCSVMGREALQAAVANYRGEELEDDHEEGALICKCFAIDEVMVRDTIRANKLSTVEDVTNYTKAGGGCSACHEGIERVLTEELAARGEVFVAAPTKAKKKKAAPVVAAEPAPAPVTEAPVAPPKMSNLQRIRRIETVLAAIRPTLQRDNGDVELIDVDGKNIYVKLTGACTGCQMASMTLGGIQQRLIEELGEFVKVIPVSAAAHAQMEV
ncbi:Modular FeS cluster scaffolding protein NifU [Azotobacter beijerinckii]|uniref:Nitrogen fixation protein NifU n=1 Tax=Azotobacter beijerinckii TaxID=170623 RepID=A0A1I4BQC7_9GAMM|nr:Fe-S cluster assembly protein NifU [Azotobacter beijerinckii]MDV7211379.1 Fe-S cluster assembly protein NifU [Azotobacter beijerinckii]SEI88079.1 Modular FeS cluster scaffolding protein NifU [Azotobacter beijerinckii]SEI93538.1 Modular FeS cluster scaffolding protein NifU [Azotobacter beijerinckii]SEP76420.1 Modular FeS cluster scaffolding protein NifU [Azotobacter beijerinckii]SFB09071.1 Modular FeS cluster scaffolding protein NifU [Azotobacter beijerinckii]